MRFELRLLALAALLLLLIATTCQRQALAAPIEGAQAFFGATVPLS